MPMLRNKLAIGDVRPPLVTGTTCRYEEKVPRAAVRATRGMERTRTCAPLDEGARARYESSAPNRDRIDQDSRSHVDACRLLPTVDLIRFARESGIGSAPPGSAAGSVVSYSLRSRTGQLVRLIFERSLTRAGPERLDRTSTLPGRVIGTVGPIRIDHVAQSHGNDQWNQVSGPARCWVPGERVTSCWEMYPPRRWPRAPYRGGAELSRARDAYERSRCSEIVAAPLRSRACAARIVHAAGVSGTHRS